MQTHFTDKEVRSLKIEKIGKYAEKNKNPPWLPFFQEIILGCKLSRGRDIVCLM